MPSLALTILYVDSPAASAALYRSLLGIAPAESSPTFAMFAIPPGVGPGSRHKSAQAAYTAGGGGELAFAMEDGDAYRAGRGLAIAKPATDMDFGRTFVALDPDRHWLRVFKPAG